MYLCAALFLCYLYCLCTPLLPLLPITARCHGSKCWLETGVAWPMLGYPAQQSHRSSWWAWAWNAKQDGCVNFNFRTRSEIELLKAPCLLCVNDCCQRQASRCFKQLGSTCYYLSSMWCMPETSALWIIIVIWSCGPNSCQCAGLTDWKKNISWNLNITGYSWPFLFSF